MTVLRNVDLPILAAALAVFLVADLPILGWVTAAGIWALWRGIGAWSDRRAAATQNPREVVGITAGSMIGRGWLLGLILLGAGLAAGDDVGLSAAVLLVALFTAHFTTKLIVRSAGPPTTTTTR